MLEFLVKNRTVLIDDQDLHLVEDGFWYIVETQGLTYARRHDKMIDGKQTYTCMHNVIMSSKWIDHIDGNGLNNQRSNLRLTTNSLNQANSHKQQGTHSRYKGVTWNKNNSRWQAYANREGIRYYGGCFIDEKEAAHARDELMLELFGVHARLNFPIGGE